MGEELMDHLGTYASVSDRLSTYIMKEYDMDAERCRSKLTPWMLLVAAVIIATGMIVSAWLFSNAIAQRPIQGSFTGTINSGSVEQAEIMDINGLRYYLGILPEKEDYDATSKQLVETLEEDILSGKWTGFPFVKLKGQLYFSKQAVDQWFFEQSRQRRIME